MIFHQKLHHTIEKNNSLLCVGLDPDPEKISNLSIFEFNKKIIEETADFVCAFKPNIAFYEAQGIKGLKSLKQTIGYIKKNYPKIPIILDAKRADIGNTAKMYAKAVFDYWNADAVTVYPHLGLDSIEPFLAYKDKLTILLFKTSNPDSGTFQNMLVNKKPYYLEVASHVKNWKRKNIGIFVGATYPKEMASLREVFPDNFFLSAGIGVQGAEIKQIVEAGIDKNGANIAFNASRSIIFAQEPAIAAQTLRDEINKYRK